LPTAGREYEPEQGRFDRDIALSPTGSLATLSALRGLHSPRSSAKHGLALSRVECYVSR